MFEEILKGSGGRLLIPLVIAFAFATVAKALFALRRSLGSERKDFLELWPQQRLLDDLWLEVAIRHFAGTYLPAPVIRNLLGAAHPSRALLDVSECWELLELETESGEVRWKVRRYADQARKPGSGCTFLTACS